MIFVIATIEISTDAIETYKAAARPCVEATRRESGCLSYDLNQDLETPHKFVFVERWQDRASLGAHFETAHLAAFAKAVGPLITHKKVEIIHPEQIEMR